MYLVLILSSAVYVLLLCMLLRLTGVHRAVLCMAYVHAVTASAVSRTRWQHCTGK
jgi:hypothetical protein